MKTNSRALAALGSLGAALTAALVGCTSHGAPHPITPVATTAPTSATSTVTTTGSHPATDGGLTATVVPRDVTTMKVGGPPIRFTVTVTNDGPDHPDLGLVVSFGHCSCGPPGASMMAAGTMRMLDPTTNSWVQAPYVREGTGMDFIMGTLVPRFDLAHGDSRTIELEAQLDADQHADITSGQTVIEPTLTDPPDTDGGLPDVIRDAHTSPLRIDVEP